MLFVMRCPNLLEKKVVNAGENSRKTQLEIAGEGATRKLAEKERGERERAGEKGKKAKGNTQDDRAKGKPGDSQRRREKVDKMLNKSKKRKKKRRQKQEETSDTE